MNIDLKSVFFGALLGGVFVAVALTYLAPKSEGNQAYGVKQGVILKGGPYFNEQEQVLNAFVEAFVKGNAEDCSELYSEDTIYMIPETPALEGRDAVFESYKEFFNNREYEIIEMKEPVSEVINFGDWAVIRGTGMDKIRSTDGKESEKTYKWMILSQKQSDGSWKMKWDIFNYDANY